MSDHESWGALRPCPCGTPSCPAMKWVELAPGVAMRWATERARILLRHLAPDSSALWPVPGAECHAMIGVDSPEGLALRAAGETGPQWHVESWEPLTISPSIRCSCGFHGFIREGRWQPA